MLPCWKTKHPEHSGYRAGVLSDKSEFVDRAEKHRRRVGVDVGVHDVYRERMGACSACRSVANVPLAFFVEAEMREPLFRQFFAAAEAYCREEPTVSPSDPAQNGQVGSLSHFLRYSA